MCVIIIRILFFFFFEFYELGSALNTTFRNAHHLWYGSFTAYSHFAKAVEQNKMGKEEEEEKNKRRDRIKSEWAFHLHTRSWHGKYNKMNKWSFRRSLVHTVLRNSIDATVSYKSNTVALTFAIVVESFLCCFLFTEFSLSDADTCGGGASIERW